ncbi:MAG: selenide, water dikinase SelD [Euryarchaeota archaeon]|nr:selenide, water dikinase SelD [Euryarchaeota archaeon]
MRGLTQIENEDLLVGAASSDDAAVYRLSEELAMVQTLDFFTPIVDDPYTYGQIAAANSLSDVYAMGGLPVTAMNVVGVPLEHLSLEDVNQILKGGADKVAEAGCVLAGGHTVQNPEPLYGLSVTGLVHPDQLITNAGAAAGALLILTKPLGTGILSTATKRGMDIGSLSDRSIALMTTLNAPGADLAKAGLVRGGTDVTGFGLLGHLGAVARESGLTAVVRSKQVPSIDDKVLSLIDEGCVPGGTKSNLEAASNTSFAAGIPDSLKLLLADAQTSGGLLLSVPPESLDQALSLLKEKGAPCAEVIGEMKPRNDHDIEVL